MVKKNFPEYPPFINRIAEQKYLHDYFKSAPTSILFLYWPKSTGKTTLIEKVYKELPKDKYAINYIDMRWVLMKNFVDFRNLFFPQSLKNKIKWIVSWIKVNLSFFGRDVDDEAFLDENIFEVMETKLRQANEKGIRPVIIIDEFQYLKDIIIDEKNNLLLVEELWKLFIRLTKVQHLAHIVCLTSDSYYIEELYIHAKLKNTSKYYLVDHLTQKDIQYWLWQKEKLSDEIVSYFRENLGGSVREVRQALIDYKNTWDYKKPIETMIQDERSKTLDFRENSLTTKEQKVFDKVSEIISKEWQYFLQKKDILWFVLIKKLVDIDIRFYDPRTRKITANSQSVRKAFQKIFA